MVLLPQDGSSGCRALTADYADAVFVLDDAERGETARPRLGVALENPGTAVTVTAVTAGSIAAAAGFQPGDVILQAAGAPISTVPELIKVVQQQPAGTWLPVEVQRDGRSLVLVAKFPEAPSLAS
jgi:S1-C subfamily serine protease